MALDAEIDDLQDDLTQEKPEGEDTQEAAQDGEEITVTIEGEAHDDEEPKDPVAQKSWIKNLRRGYDEANRKARELERRLAEVEAAKQAEAEPEDPGPMPRLQDVDFDDEKLEKAVKQWVEDTKAFEATKASRKAKEDAEKARWESIRKGYDEGKKSLGVPDYKASEDAVVSILSQRQQNAILEVIEDPAKFVYALGRNPAKAEELAKLGDTAKFVAAIAKLEGKITVERKTPPPPETRLPGSNSGIGQRVDLDKLRDKARKTGDYTEYYAAKSRLEKAGQKT